MNTLQQRLKQRLNKQERSHLTRYVSPKNNELINFSSNDYLGLSKHPSVIKSLQVGALTYGLGSGSSHLISGYHDAHQALEKTFTQLTNRESSLLFNSGYHANIAVLSAITDKQSVIFADKHCHASIIDGLKLSTGRVFRYQHNNLDHLVHRLNNAPEKNPRFIVSESVFSMSGEISDLDRLAHIAETFSATLILDDAHGFGLLGQNGLGAGRILSQQQLPILITPFGKALGSMGALVSGSDTLIDALRQFAKSYGYSTALPPIIAHASLTALQEMTHAHSQREKLNRLITYFQQEGKKMGLSILKSSTPIQIIPTSSPEHALSIQKALGESGFLVGAIRPPSVPQGGSCLRISLTSKHQESQLSTLITLIKRGFDHG